MKEHKYRAWHKQEQKMVYFSLGELLGNYCDEFNFCALADTDLYRWHDSDDLEIMEYTARKDRKGVSLYDGDIIKHAEGRVALVFWNNTAFCWDLRAISTEGTPIAFKKLWTIEFEIIGNIHQNPDLLEKQP